MKRRLEKTGFFQDERGVALTEFVIVFPVVMLLFLAMLQYSEIVQAAQLGNYAAYVAARAYSVRAAADNTPDSFSAQSAAQFSAAMALAPVASLINGGSGGIGSGLSALSSLMGGGKFGQFTKGFGIAYVILSVGGTFSASTNSVGSLTSADVTINYPQQINIPAFSAIWNFVAGDNITTSLLPLDNGMSLGLSFLTGMPFINIPSKCSTGCEEWSGTMKEADSSPAKYQSSSNWQ